MNLSSEHEVVTTKKQISKKPGGNSHGSATLASILGRTATKGKKNGEPVKIKAEWQKYYNRLLELREQLLKQMSGLAKESAEEMAGYSLHMADSGTDNFDRDFALSLLSSDQDALYEIEEALKRLEALTQAMQSSEMPLEEALAAYQEGNELVQYCQNKLAEVEQKLHVLDEGGLKELSLEAE